MCRGSCQPAVPHEVLRVARQQVADLSAFVPGKFVEFPIEVEAADQVQEAAEHCIRFV